MALALLLGVDLDDLHASMPINLISHLTTDLQNSMVKLGAASTQIILDIAELILYHGGLSSSVTLDHLYRFTRTQCVFVATSLTREERVYLSHETHPHVRVVDAIAASCCIPGVFRPVFIDGEVLIDGNILESIPSPFPCQETLYLIVESDSSVPPRPSNMDVTSYTSALLSVITRYKMQLERIPRHRRVMLHDPSPSFDPFLTDEMTQRIRLNGYMQTMSFLLFGCERVLKQIILCCITAQVRASVTVDLTTTDAEEEPPSPESSAAAPDGLHVA